MRNSAMHRRLLGALLLLAYLPACHTWRTGNVEPAALLARDHPDRVRVTRMDGSQIILAGPHTRGDSLVGYSHGDRVALAFTEVAGVAERKGDVWKALALGIAISGFTVAVACLDDPRCFYWN